MVEAKVRLAKGSRLLTLMLIVFLLFLILASRLIWIQAVEAKKYSEIAKKQRVKSGNIFAQRGRIYDRNLQELAISVDCADIVANPFFIKDKKEAAKKIAPILDLPEDEILEKISQKKGYVYLARKVSVKKAKKIIDLKIEGVSQEKQRKRCYPNKTLASQTLGIVGMDNEGLSGLELYYDDYLKGEEGKLIAETDPLGRVMPGGIIQKKRASQGKNIVLTIDKDIQYIADEKIKETVDKYSAKSGFIIVMNPKTGEIYALSIYPNFDLNDFSETPEDTFRNIAISDTFEPGSTMKTIIASAALEEKISTPETIFHTPSRLQVADRVITDSHERPAMDQTMTQIVTSSSNIGAVMIGQNLGKNRIYKYIGNFGLNSKTGIDFPGEAIGFTPHPDNWSGSTIGNIPFGQGLSVTPLQMTKSIAIIANNGMNVRPHFLKEVRDSSGKIIKEYEQKIPEKIISSKTVEQMNQILTKVTEEGTAEAAKVEGYSVAGKTGTAQKPRKNGKGYEVGMYLASFIGYAPESDPELVISVFIDEPRGVYYGGAIAAPVFSEVAEFSLNRLQIKPDNDEEQQTE